MALLIALLALIPLTIFRGWTIAKLWGWFVVPTFGGPTLTISAAIGLSIVVSLFTPTTSTKGKKLLEAFIEAFFLNLFALFMGWLVLLLS